MELKSLRNEISKNCESCGRCTRDCLFLKVYGPPRDIACNPEFNGKYAYECSQCRLCESVCPDSLPVPDMLYEFRCDALKRDKSILDKYKKLLRFEALGNSKYLSAYIIPKGCDTVLFPGCSFSHTRSDLVKKLYRAMKEDVKNLGIVLDCCFKPSKSLGRKEFFKTKFEELKKKLTDSGIKKIISVCTSCYATLKENLSCIDVSFIYEELQVNKGFFKIEGGVHVLDPCAVRFDEKILSSVRRVLIENGITVDELKDSKEKTFCCGEGGGTHYITPEYMENWQKKRSDNITKTPVTYCAGCNNTLNTGPRPFHIMDILLKSKKKKRPLNFFGYIRRALLKRHLERTIDVSAN